MKQKQEQQLEQQPEQDFFLPDFCGLRMVFTVVLLSELFALILTVGQSGTSMDLWSDLALISFFMQWVGLSCAGVLCLAHRPLSRLGNDRAAMVSYLLLLIVIALLSEAAYQVGVATAIQLVTPNHLEFLLRNITIGAIVSALILRYLYVQFQWRRRVKAEGEARVQALQARIRPHFLFNSMNTIASLIPTRPQVAEETIEDLADLFRASMSDVRQLIPLKEELSMAERYMCMEQLRMGERLKLELDVDELPMDLLLPPLTLQPLLENTVYHGIEPLPEGGTVRVSGSRSHASVDIVISNPLPAAGVSLREPGHHMAQANIRARLEAHFEHKASLQVEQDEHEYRVRIRLPYAGKP